MEIFTCPDCLKNYIREDRFGIHFKKCFNRKTVNANYRDHDIILYTCPNNGDFSIVSKSQDINNLLKFIITSAADDMPSFATTDIKYEGENSYIYDCDCS